MSFVLIGKGAAKTVSILALTAAGAYGAMNSSKVLALTNKVFCTPTKFWQESTLRREVTACNTINARLASLQQQPTHLATSYKESPIQVRKQYTLMCDRASGNLEQAIENPRLSFGKRLGYCQDACTALTQLHLANYVHQDIKLDNFLVFGNTVKLSDFGTVKPQSSNTVSFHNIGNARYACPENLSSHAGEVFNLGLVCIRILEEALLLKTHQTTLVAPKRGWFRFQLKQERGVVQYLIAHKDTERASRTLIGKYLQRLIAYVRHWFGMKPSIDYTHQATLYAYLDAMSSQLSSAGLTSQSQAKRITSFLQRMTASDPSVRPTARQAAQFFQDELPVLYRAKRYLF